MAKHKAIPLPGMQPREMKYMVIRKSCTKMFTAVLIPKSREKKSKCPSTDKWIVYPKRSITEQ